VRPLRLVLVLAALALALPWPGTAAPTITEFAGGFTANRGPSGIAPGPDGNLWLAQFKGSGGVARVTPTGDVTEFTANLGLDPVDVVAGPDGNLWVTLQKDPGGIARITPAGTVTVFQAGLTPNSRPTGITAGPDDALWFTALANPGRIGRITTSGAITEFPVGLLNDKDPTDITAGPDGNLWFTYQKNPGGIGRITPAGVVTNFQAGLTANSEPTQITAGPDGALWFTERANPGRIGRITTTGAITEFPTGLLDNMDPTGITAGDDGNLWFTYQRNPGGIGRITPAGVVTNLSAGLTGSSQPTGIAAGPDGAVWFTESADPGRVGRITVGPSVRGTTASTVDHASATVSAMIAPNIEDTTYRVEWGPTAAYGQQTPATVAPAASGAQLRSVALTGLAPETTYHYRVIATNATATTSGPDATFTTAAVPAPPYVPPAPDPFVPADPFTPEPRSDAPTDPVATVPAPAVGVRVGASPASGTVRVRVPGSTRFTELDGAGALPVGSVIDTRGGTVRLTSALPGGRTQAALFWDGVFTVRQARTGSGETRLVMPRITGCPAATPRRRAAEDARRRPSRRPSLWGKDSNGRYRTDGANSVATVRGTVWQTVERCDGTLTRVREGVVLVRDLRLGRTVRLTAGRSYLARSR
jgi:streptogramin lyase